MKTLYDICKGGIFFLGGKRYKLYSNPRQGGSSLVYTAEILDETEKGFCMIKEFFPSVFGAIHDDDGNVSFPLAKEADLRRMKEKARRESEIANSLRIDYDERTNSAWVFQYHMPIEQNNTLYTVIQTEKGHMLSLCFEEKTFDEMDFVSVCGCILMILDAIAPIHEKNHLHLDVAPDNIHFSEAKFARLIDYNSAYSMGGKSTEEPIFSTKPGYSAPELEKWHPGKLPNFTPATDLYSVAAIFFQILTGEKAHPGDSRSLAWHLNKNSLHMKTASQLLIDETNKFLVKGLSMQKRRFQSAKKMRQAVENLIELCVRREVSDWRKSTIKPFVGRSEELRKIDEKLNEHKFIYIEGMAGIGKTELAKQYADTSGEKYRIIQFINFKGNLQTTIAEKLKIQNFDITRYEKAYGKNRNEFIRQVYMDKMETLNECGKDTLIIVDGCDADIDFDAEFGRFVATGGFKIIFTLRMTHDNDANVVKVEQMQSKDDLFALFEAYYKNLAEKEKALVGDIIDIVQGHTMVIMLIAASMLENSTSSAEMFELLRDSFDTGLSGAVKIKKEGATVAEQILYEHLRILFDMEKLDEDERENEKYREIMMDMSLVYPEGIEMRQFLHWTSSKRYRYPLDERDNIEYSPEEYAYIERLIRLRRIQHDRDEGKIFLLAPESEIVADTLKPDCDECHCLLSALRDCAEATDGMTYARQIEWLEMVKFACKRLKHANTHKHALAFDLYLNKAITHGNVGDYDSTVKSCDEAVKIANTKGVKIDAARMAAVYATRAEANIALGNMEEAKLDAKQQEFLAKAETDLGGSAKRYVLFVTPLLQKGKCAKSMGMPHEAIEHFAEALARCKEIYGPANNKHSAVIMEFMATAYSDLGELEKALGIYNQILGLYDKASADYAACYANIGEIYAKQGLADPSKLNTARNFLQESLGFFTSRYESDFLPPIANVYHNLGFVYHAKLETDKSLEYLQKALEIRRSIYSYNPNHAHIGESYLALGDCYYTREDYAEAAECAKKSLSVFESAFCCREKTHALIFRAVFLLAKAYNEMGKNNEAIDAAVKACAVAEEIYDATAQELFHAYRLLGFAYRDANHTIEAVRQFQKALKAAEIILPPFSPAVNELKIALGELS